MHPEQLSEGQLEALPFSSDGMAYWGVLRHFVEDAFNDSVALKSVLSARWRRQTFEWWESLNGALGERLPWLEQDGLVELVTYLIFNVTAMHGHVGDVAPYLRHPGFAAGRVWKHSSSADIQNSIQLSTIAIATGLRVPTIVGDFSHLMPDPGAREAAGRFRERLMACRRRWPLATPSDLRPSRAFCP